jgi:hypothetical protein
MVDIKSREGRQPLRRRACTVRLCHVRASDNTGYNNAHRNTRLPSRVAYHSNKAAVDAPRREVRRTQDQAVQRQSIRIHTLHVQPSDRLNLTEALLTASVSPLTVSRTF